MADDDRIVSEYFGSFSSILDKSGIVRDRSALKHNVKAREIRAGDFTKLGDIPTGIRLVGDSFLSFVEKVDIIDGKLKVSKYTYRFVSSDGQFSFRYDKDPRSHGKDIWDKPNGTKAWHPMYHFHFMDFDEPRYKSHETHLEEMLVFIKMSFVPT